MAWWCVVPMQICMCLADRCLHVKPQISLCCVVTASQKARLRENFRHRQISGDEPEPDAGSFPNEAVVKLAGEKLKAAEGGPVHPAQASNYPTDIVFWEFSQAGRSCRLQGGWRCPSWLKRACPPYAFLLHVLWDVAGVKVQIQRQPVVHDRPPGRL